MILRNENLVPTDKHIEPPVNRFRKLMKLVCPHNCQFAQWHLPPKQDKLLAIDSRSSWFTLSREGQSLTEPSLQT